MMATPGLPSAGSAGIPVAAQAAQGWTDSLTTTAKDKLKSVLTAQAEFIEKLKGNKPQTVERTYDPWTGEELIEEIGKSALEFAMDYLRLRSPTAAQAPKVAPEVIPFKPVPPHLQTPLPVKIPPGVPPIPTEKTAGQRLQSTMESSGLLRGVAGLIHGVGQPSGSVEPIPEKVKGFAFIKPPLPGAISAAQLG